MQKANKKRDFTGRKFCKLTVLKLGASRNGIAYWLCECECGKMKTVSAYNLMNGQVKSCGCLKNPERSCWARFRKSSCESWQDFDNFLSDMGNKPKGCVLRRKDKSKPYSKENCAWIPSYEKTAEGIEYNGRKMSLTAWASELGMKPNKLYKRLFVFKWTIEEAFNKEKYRRSRKS